MSAAQMLAMQVGEVAGIQVLETVQASLEHRRGLSNAAPGTAALLHTFHWPFAIGAVIGCLGIIAALFFRQFERDKDRLKK
jgi:hypothetical protein